MLMTVGRRDGPGSWALPSPLPDPIVELIAPEQDSAPIFLVGNPACAHESVDPGLWAGEVLRRVSDIDPRIPLCSTGKPRRKKRRQRFRKRIERAVVKLGEERLDDGAHLPNHPAVFLKVWRRTR